MNPIEVVYDGGLGRWVVARVAQRGTQTFIEYTDDHLARGAELAPPRHTTSDRARAYRGREVDQLPGLIADSLPGSWGRLVLRRDMRRHHFEQPTPLQMLTWLGRSTMGALAYRPARGPDLEDTPLVDLDRVQREALRHLGGPRRVEEAADRLPRVAGSVAGGMRPKIAAAFSADGTLAVDNGTVPAGATPRLVKPHAQHHPDCLSAIEATWLFTMKATAGVTTCEHRLLTGSSGTTYLAVRRFDRLAVADGQPLRLHMATAAGLLEAYPQHGQHLCYVELMRLTRFPAGDVRDVEEVCAVPCSTSSPTTAMTMRATSPVCGRTGSDSIWPPPST